LSNVDVLLGEAADLMRIPFCLVYRKEAEISSLNTKLESEQSLVAQLQKKIKELQVSKWRIIKLVDRRDNT